MPEIIINGPEGRIEARYHQAAVKNAPAVVILHPHPRHGGTMNNKVVYNLYHTFVQNGFSTLRFNFRGVGRSQGEFDAGVGELCDAATALDWLQMQNQDASTFWICGFSFGAWVSMQLLMRRPELDSFVVVAPPTNMYDFSFLSPCPSSGLVIQGDQDSIVPEDSVSSFAKKLGNQKSIDVDYRVVRGADHFFRDKLDEMNGACTDYINENLEKFIRRPRVKPDRRRRQLPHG